MEVDISSVLDIDPALLSHGQRIELLEALEHARAALDFQQQRLLCVLADSDPSEQVWVRDEVACVLQIAPMTASAKLHEAVELMHLLPLTAEFLADATIQHRHARVMVEHTRHLDDDTRSAVEQRVLSRAAGKTVSEFRQSVRRAVAALDPRGAQERYVDAMEQRRVAISPQDDGMCEFWALLSTDGAARLMATVSARAAGCDDPADTRTADQRRADALVDLGSIGPVGTETAGSRRGRAPSGPRVEVTVALSTLVGIDEQPGDLAGHGPIPAAMARELAFDPTGTWRRIITDPAGRALAVSPHYRPPPRLADHVVARDRVCRFPGCRRSAARCELDHVRPRSRGGATSIENLHALCRRHHHLKHDAPGWSVIARPGGSTEWTAPSGNRYQKDAASYDVAESDDLLGGNLLREMLGENSPA